MLKSVLGEDARNLVTRIKLTALDIAVDVYGVPISSLMFFSNRTGDSHVWGRHFDRKHEDRLYIQTCQVGSKKSRKSVTVYDKMAERRSKGFLHENGENCVRIEGHLRPSITVEGKPRHGLFLHELHSLPNPLENFNIALYFPQKSSGWVFELFLHATRQIGTQAALAIVSKAKRSSFRAQLEACAVDWWQPEKVIGGIPDALKATGLFPPESFG